MKRSLKKLRKSTVRRYTARLFGKDDVNAVFSFLAQVYDLNEPDAKEAVPISALDPLLILDGFMTLLLCGGRWPAPRDVPASHRERSGQILCHGRDAHSALSGLVDSALAPPLTIGLCSFRSIGQFIGGPSFESMFARYASNPAFVELPGMILRGVVCTGLRYLEAYYDELS